MSLSAGTRLGPYEILTPLGAGGMGEVYKARDTRLDRIVAIKVLAEHLSQKPQLRERFEREARAVSSLNHSNICTLHDVGQQDDVDYLVMEYLEGDTLAQRLKKGPLPLDQTLRYAIEIAGALDHAHRHGVVHRDLKPGNIMLTKAGAKVLDFGLAKVHAAAMPNVTQPTNTLTEEGVILGTLQYMAPEQLEGKDADARTDIFAFGVVVYEMVTGKKAFEGQSRASVIAAIMNVQPPPINTLAQMSPPLLDRTVNRCLAKDPDERWQSAHDLKNELQWISEAGSPEGAPATVVAHSWNRERLAWTVATVAVLLTLAGGAVSFRHFREPQPEMRPIRFQVFPPEKMAFADDTQVVSPNGRWLVFPAVAPNAKPQLWLRKLDSLMVQPLAGTEDAWFPFWSPDSRYIGFYTTGKLKKIEVSGGPVQTLCEAPGAPGFSSTATWSSDGSVLFEADPGSLYRVPASGGTATPVTHLDAGAGETAQHWPQFLPDGRHFIFLSLNSKGSGLGLYAASLDQSQNRKLLLSTDWKVAYSADPGAKTGQLLFWHDNALMAQPFDPRKLAFIGEPVPVAEQNGRPDPNYSRAFSLSENGVLAYPTSLPVTQTEFVWFDRTGRRRGAVGKPGPYGDVLRLSPDQKQMGVMNIENSDNWDIWIVDVSRGIPSRFTFDKGMDGNPVFSPDGKQVVFGSNRNGLWTPYLRAANGAGSDEMLFQSSRNGGPWDWSLDGRFILLAQFNQKGRWELWVLPARGAASGDRKPFAFLQSEFNQTQAAFSPDVRWVAYASDESGKFEIYVRTFTGKPAETASGGKWLISTAGGSLPRWRRDGKELFYMAADGNIMSVDVKSGKTFEAGVPKLLFDTHRNVGDMMSSVYDVSADGQRFIVVMPAQETSASSPVTVVVNWDAGLKR